MKTTQRSIAGRTQDILRRVIGKIGQVREGHYSVDFIGETGHVCFCGPSARVQVAMAALGGEVETLADRRIVPDTGAPFVIRRYRASDHRLLGDARFTDDGYGSVDLWYFTTDARNAATIVDLD